MQRRNAGWKLIGPAGHHQITPTSADWFSPYMPPAPPKPCIAPRGFCGPADIRQNPAVEFIYTQGTRLTMTTTELGSIAEAEKLLNRTLVYQAALAVHELKDGLDLDVGELRLVVSPASSDAPGCYRVTWTIASPTEPNPFCWANIAN